MVLIGSSLRRQALRQMSQTGKDLLLGDVKAAFANKDDATKQ